MKRSWFKTVGLALAGALLYVVLFLHVLGPRLEPLALDLWFRVRGPIETPADMVLVGVDEESYRALGVPLRDAIPRRHMAELLRRLHRVGAQRVVIDYVYHGSGRDRDEDRQLAEAMALGPTVIASHVTARRWDPAELELLGDQAKDAQPYKIEMFTPAAQFAARATVGNIGVRFHHGIVRQFALKQHRIRKDIPSLAEAAAGLTADAEGGPGPRDFINYYGPCDWFPHVSLSSVLSSDDQRLASLFRGKIVFVGYMLRVGRSDTVSKDSFLTPYHEPHTFGIEIHANAAANLLNKGWIRRIPEKWEAIGGGLAAFVLCLLCLMARPLPGGIVVGACAVVWGVLSYQAFLRGLFIPGLVLVAVVMPVVYVTGALHDYFVVYRVQRKIRSAFSRYLSPDMVKEIAEQPDALKLGSKLIQGTALMTDIAGFTSLIETMPTQTVSAQLNQYFTELTRIVLEHKGTLVKFLGDGMFVVWGAPLAVENQSRLALSSAVLIQQRVQNLIADGTLPPFYTRIGLHSGAMLVGNFGSEERFDYTAMGDSINLASRLEGLNKYFKTSILFSQAVLDEILEPVDSLEIGTVRVVGRAQVLRVYTVLPQMPEEPKRAVWLTALQAFRKRDWDAADSGFGQVASTTHALKGAAELYRTEIAKHRAQPPAEDWRGEIVFETK